MRSAELTKIEFVVDVLDRSDKAAAIARLNESGYDCDTWDDPVDGTLSIYAARELQATLEGIVGERETIKRILAGLRVAIEDWGTAIPP